MGFEPTTASLGGSNKSLITMYQRERNFEWSEFRKWIYSKYSKNYAKVIGYYVRKYSPLMDNNKIRELELLPDSIKNNVIKSLTVLSKYLGIYEEFRSRLKRYGIKLKRPDSFTSFLRILNSNNNDILDYYNKAINILRSNEKLYLKFLLFTGLRKEEGIIAFNKIIELAKNNQLPEYYDNNLNCLLHFKYPKEFIRKTKNCFISFVKPELVNEMALSEHVSYNVLRKYLNHKGLNVRLHGFRDFYGTYLLQHGILEAEINLLQGRIPPSIFVKHYWSPKLTELRDRIFEALNKLEQQLN